MISKKAWLVLWLAALASCAALYAANLMLGEVNQDEGWYLNSALLVASGKLPYIDFAYMQGPVLPHVYSLAAPLIDRYGVAGGRLVTGFAGVLSVFAAAWIAAMMVSGERKKLAFFSAFCLAGINVYQSYFTTIVKTYALSGLFLTLGIGLAILVSYRGRLNLLWALLSGVVMGLSAGVRLSAVVAIPLAFVYIIYEGRKSAPQGTGGITAYIPGLMFAAGSTAAILLLYLPAFIRAPDSLLLQFMYHGARDQGGIVKMLAYKAGFISRLVQDYFVAAALLAVTVISRLTRKGGAGGDENGRGLSSSGVFVWMCILLVTLVHFMAPFPYDDYQVVIYPVLAAAVAVASVGLFRSQVAAAVSILLLCAASSMSSPINQGWFIGRQDRMWWPMKTESPLARLHGAGWFIRSLAPGGGTLLTQDAYLAVESGMKVPPGLEMGPFSYFPDLPDEKARACRVVNREMLFDILEKTDAKVAAFSDWGFAVSSPSITAVPDQERRIFFAKLEERFDLCLEIPDFGHGSTTLKIYVRKPERNDEKKIE